MKGGRRMDATRRAGAHKEKAGRRPGSIFCIQKPGLFDYRALDGFGIRPTHELDQRHRRRVARPEAELEDAQVAARARLVARAKLVEELGHDIAIAQTIERDA